MAKALGVPFGRASRDDGRLMAGSGPGEWLILAPVGTAAQVVRWLGELASEAAPEEFVSVIDLTHGRALVRITGRKVAELLAKLCGVDLADDLTPDGAAFRGSGRRRGHRRDPGRPGRGPPPTCCTVSGRPASTSSAPWSARANR